MSDLGAGHGPRLAGMEGALIAEGPDPHAHRQLLALGPLIGSWSLVVDNIRPDGSVDVTDAEWHFNWALGGRAVVDVWISPSRQNAAPSGPEEWGMSVRFYDEAIGRIRSTWHGPHRGWVIPFLARASDDEITLDGDHDGLEVRWTFSDITPQAFKWRAAERPPGGEWRVRQRFAATRIDP